ncbi:MAG: KilA-N domain-containing protein [Bacteroidaceae bacterium]|nr:KilA-N domain-containing protein [Bacteroidaceae bacterium]
MSVSEWIEKTNAIGIIVKKGRYGGTYAFKDIAFEFGTAISVTFKLYLIDEFQRLKEEEQKQLGTIPHMLLCIEKTYCPCLYEWD